MAFFGGKFRFVGLEALVDVIVPLLIASFIVFNTMLGSVYERKGKLEEAIAQYAHAVRTEPERADARLRLGAALINADDRVKLLPGIQNLALAVELAPLLRRGLEVAVIHSHVAADLPQSPQPYASDELPESLGRHIGVAVTLEQQLTAQTPLAQATMQVVSACSP